MSQSRCGSTRSLVLSALGVFILVVGCATPNEMINPEQLVGQGMVAPGTNIEALRRGLALAVTECTSCHRLYYPNEYSPQEWPGIIRRMGGRASLSDSQIRDLELYYVAASKSAQRPPG